MERRRRSSTKPYNLLRKIRELTGSLLEDLCNGRSPVVALDRYRNYCTDLTGNCCCSSDKHKGKEILSLQRECYAHRLNVLLRVLLIVQQLLQENKHGSKRDIYYMHPTVFSEQAVVDRAINDICILLKCSRHNLNVVCILICMSRLTRIYLTHDLLSRLVMGWLRFLEGERKFDCINSPNTVRKHTGTSNLRALYVIQIYITGLLAGASHSLFQRLADDHFCDTNHCIIVTGRGYPDVPTRRFLRLLLEKLHLPAYCLVDCDPYGFDILTTYRFGSMQMAYDAKFLRLPEVRWLGAFPSDSENYQLPERCLLPLTAEDKRKAEAMLLRCYLHQEAPQWRLNSTTFVRTRDDVVKRSEIRD
ncbi:Spo11/DNA topoisomerase VI [Macleaya cordata]|uniref:DNA topoisomerase (ATP-hydrolyzing) n=1 Tax=Macleaya cordata TaxID=56857 RepID=A0A200PVD7_MACCD|nr:Spo11/DNA topoisomerase VI [Macleaya cordata]